MIKKDWLLRLASVARFIVLIIIEPFYYYYLQLASKLGIVNLSKIYYGNKKRKPVKNSIVRVCVHEWGGYSLEREKNFSETSSNECGLKFQLQRFLSYRENGFVNLTVTMSDSNKHNELEYVKQNCDNFLEVSNVGMDFSGYSTFFHSIENNDNCYVILTNSSVEKSQTDFLEGYIKYMVENPDVGMLGISYSTRMYHTLIRRNFIPHIQSFFVMTTLDVLKEIVRANKGKFPGENADYKRLLIRKGEIPLSRLALKLGYRLAVVYPEDGVPFKFTDKKHWTHPFDDLRLICSKPSYISEIKSQSYPYIV